MDNTAWQDSEFTGNTEAGEMAAPGQSGASGPAGEKEGTFPPTGTAPDGIDDRLLTAGQDARWLSDGAVNRNGNGPSAIILLDEEEVPARLEHLIRIRERVTYLARCAGLDETSVDEVKLAVGEAFVNAVRYGSSGPQFNGNGELTPLPLIQVRVFSDGRSLVIEIQDSGEGFEPESIRPPAIEELIPHGRGIFFMQVAMDEVTFSFNHGTLVRMIKHLNRPEGARDSS